MSWMDDGFRLMSDSDLQETVADDSKYPPEMRDAIHREVERRKNLPRVDSGDGGPTTPSLAEPGAQGPGELRQSMLNRYLDAYRVANLTVRFGDAIKVAGIVLGILTFLALANSMGSTIAGVVFGLIVAGFGFCIGIVVAAQGQLLKATLDTAVNSSPFLNDDQRLRIMSIE